MITRLKSDPATAHVVRLARSVGNVIHFCHWRKIERMIEMLGDQDVTGTIH